MCVCMCVFALNSNTIGNLKIKNPAEISNYFHGVERFSTNPCIYIYLVLRNQQY